MTQGHSTNSSSAFFAVPSVLSGVCRWPGLVTSLTLLAWFISMAPVRAESGAYVPPNNDTLNGVAGLMSGSGGNNGYGLGALMAQQGVTPSSSSSDSASSSSGGALSSSSHRGSSVVSGGEGPSSSSAAVIARKAMRAENRKLKDQVTTLTTKVDALTKQLAKMQSQSAPAGEPQLKLTVERDALKQSLSDSQKKLSSVQTELSVLNTRLAASEVERKDADAARHTAESGLKDMAAKLRAGEKASALSSASAGELTLAKAALAQKVADLKGSQDALAKAQTALKKTQGELTLAETNLSEVRAAERAAQLRNDTLAVKVTAMTEQLTNSQAAKSAAEKLLAEVRQTASTSVAMMKADINSQVVAQVSAATEKSAAQVKYLTASLASATSERDSAQAAQKDAGQQLLALRQQMITGDEARTQLENTLKDVRGQLAQANERASKAGRAQKVPLDSDMRKEAYVVGQAMAVGLREKLRGYTSTGMGLDLIRVQAGLTDGLQEKMKLPRKEMDQHWQHFADRLNKQVTVQVKAGELLIASKVKGHKPDRVVDGITYVVAKKGKAIKDESAPVTLSLREQIADGKVISQLPSLTLSPDDDMPAVMREALPLLGEGAEVTAWALAKVVYGERPLPPSVMPFTVLEYHMQGLKAK